MGETPRNSNRTKIEQLYDAFVDALVDALAPEATPDAATLNVVRQFLKDKNVDADPDTHDGLKKLTKKPLPFQEGPSEGDL